MMSTVSMEKFLSGYPSPQEGLDTLGLSELFDLIDSVDVREDSSAADNLAERMALAKSEHGIRDTWAWLQKNFGLSHGRVNQIITRQPVVHLQHHLRHVTAVNLRPGYRFIQLQYIWQILKEVPEGFLYGDNFQVKRERLDTTLDQYLPEAASPELFWLCFHASLDGLLNELPRKEAGVHARLALESLTESLEELWLLDPLQHEPIPMWDYIREDADTPTDGVDDGTDASDDLEALDIALTDSPFDDEDDASDGEPISAEAMDDEDAFEASIRKHYGKQAADLLF